MSTNEVFDNPDYLSLPVPDGTLSGVALRVGGTAAAAINVVTQTKEGEGGNPDNFASCALKGVFKLPIGTTTTMAALDPVYITSGNALTPSSSGNQLFGHILEAKGSTAGEVHRVRLAQPTA